MGCTLKVKNNCGEIVSRSLILNGLVLIGQLAFAGPPAQEAAEILSIRSDSQVGCNLFLTSRGARHRSQVKTSTSESRPVIYPLVSQSGTEGRRFGLMAAINDPGTSSASIDIYYGIPTGARTAKQVLTLEPKDFERDELGEQMQQLLTKIGQATADMVDSNGTSRVFRDFHTSPVRTAKVGSVNYVLLSIGLQDGIAKEDLEELIRRLRTM